MARPATNLEGQVFGEWTIIKRDGQIGANAAWLCRCRAGHEKRIGANRLKDGRAMRCARCSLGKIDAIYARDIEFVQFWQAASSVAEVADQLNITLQEARRVAIRLRNHDVPLKHMAASSKAQVHYEKLRRLIVDRIAAYFGLD